MLFWWLPQYGAASCLGAPEQLALRTVLLRSALSCIWAVQDLRSRWLCAPGDGGGAAAMHPQRRLEEPQAEEGEEEEEQVLMSNCQPIVRVGV